MRIFGMREEAGENCVSKVFDLVTAKLGRKLTDQDIEVAHRLPADRKRLFDPNTCDVIMRIE